MAFYLKDFKIGMIKATITGSGITPLVTSITYSGTYATSTYFRVSDCSVFYNADGRVGIVMRGGTDTSYENLLFTLVNNTGQSISLIGQSVNNYASATAGQYYIGVLTGITSPVSIAVQMNTRNSTADNVTCAINVNNP